ncbi:MAG: heavy metal translocating P-type ATPase [Sulfolobales archaeon]
MNKFVKVVYNPLEITREEIINLIRSLNYEISEVKEEKIFEDLDRRIILNELNRLRLYVAISLPLSIVLAIYYMLGYLGFDPPFWGSSLFRDLFIGIPLSTIVLFIGSIKFLRPAIRSFVNLSPGMDALVILGTYSTYIFSLASTLGLVYGESFYEAGAVVMSFVLLGRYLETRLKLRTGEAVRKLAELQSKSAKVLRNGSEQNVSIDEVKVGDIVVVRSGERIPVDGVIDEGWGFIDESIMTGESIPQRKSAGDPVFAGTMLVKGFLRIYTTRVGRDTVLSQIIRLVRIAQSSKPEIQRIIDKIAGIFTWIVIVVALSTFIYWFIVARVSLDLAVLFMASVLVVACPCALGLATPVALVVGFGKAAETGILIRNTEVIDKISKIDVVIFDKTGTLTIGRPRVVLIRSFVEGVGEKEILGLAAVCEKRSEHPIALAIVEEAERRGLAIRDPDNFENIPGQGVLAWVGENFLAVGNERLMRNIEASLSEDIIKIAEELMRQGLTVVYVAVNKRVVGLLAVGDTPRPEAREVIKYLLSRGRRIIMLTGDKEDTARAVAFKLGINEVFAEVSPEDKAEIIEKIRGEGFVVAMIGDGINDAVSLSKADLGIAMGGGADITREAGDAVLMRNNLFGIIDLFELINSIRRKIYQNILWAFIYNITLIPLAAGVFYGSGIYLRPELAGFAMAMSSISVTLSSYTLKRWKPSTSARYYSSNYDLSKESIDYPRVSS